ncbi:hypothetical protein JCM10213_002014 [Rhodosporidiobolus nylandii]
MFDSAGPAFGERIRSFSAGGVAVSTTAPTGRTIYSYSTPSSPFAPYQRTASSQAYQLAPPEPAYAAPAPCNCPDCYTDEAPTSAPPSYVADYPSTSYQPATTSLQLFPYPAESYQPYPQTEPPLYRPVARRPESAPYSSIAPTPFPSPPMEELPHPEPVFYQPSWGPSPGHSPPTLQPPLFERQRARTSDGVMFAYQPQTPLPSSPHLLTPFSLKANFERRRSSASSSLYDGQTLSRRSSALSLQSPFGSEQSYGSYGSDEVAAATTGERHETATPFMVKLTHMLDGGEPEIIRWNAEGTAFIFAQQTSEFADLLSRTYRHNNSHSFVRQLNIYDFKRLSSLELHAAFESVPMPQSNLTSADFAGFSHPAFFRDSHGRTCDLTKLKPKMIKKAASTKTLAAKTSQLGLSSASKSRALRSDGKVGGTVRGRKL